MQTYSHYIVSAVFVQPLKKRFPQATERIPEFRVFPFLLGSFIPDLSLILISIGAIFYDVVIAGIDMSQMGPENPNVTSITSQLFREWYFTNPLVFVPHNLFHAPLMCLIFLGLGYWGWKNGRKWGSWLFWLTIAAMGHALIDIPLHVDDGALTFFPLNWTYRFRAPISYWDPQYYGRQWSIFEHSLDLLLIVYLLFNWFKRRQNKSLQSPPPNP